MQIGAGWGWALTGPAIGSGPHGSPELGFTRHPATAVDGACGLVSCVHLLPRTA